MATPAKRLASNARKAPLFQIGARIIEGTRFLFASIVLVYVLILVSSSDRMTSQDALEKPFQTTELSNFVLLGLSPVLNIAEFIPFKRLNSV